MKTTDFSRTLIRCSSIGQIMTAPMGKSPRQKWEDAVTDLEEAEKKYAALDAKYLTMATGRNLQAKIVKLREEEEKLRKYRNLEPLSQTAKAHLCEVYAEVKYGKKSSQKLKGNKFTQKGKLVEEDGIDLISHLDRRMLRKNDVRLTNDYLTGEPDLYIGDDIRRADYVIDVKCSWDAITFFANVGQPLNPDYYAQLQGYYALTGSPAGEISYCLISAPDSVLNDEKRKLFYSMGVATEGAPEYVRAEEELMRNMTFDDIPMEHRRLKFPVERDEAYIDKVYQKVEQCRLYLSEIERMHLGELLQEIKELETV